MKRTNRTAKTSRKSRPAKSTPAKAAGLTWEILKPATFCRSSSCVNARLETPEGLSVDVWGYLSNGMPNAYQGDEPEVAAVVDRVDRQARQISGIPALMQGGALLLETLAKSPDAEQLKALAAVVTSYEAALTQAIYNEENGETVPETERRLIATARAALVALARR